MNGVRLRRCGLVFVVIGSNAYRAVLRLLRLLRLLRPLVYAGDLKLWTFEENPNLVSAKTQK